MSEQDGRYRGGSHGGLSGGSSRGPEPWPQRDGRDAPAADQDRSGRGQHQAQRGYWDQSYGGQSYGGQSYGGGSAGPAGPGGAHGAAGPGQQSGGRPPGGESGGGSGGRGPVGGGAAGGGPGGRGHGSGGPGSGEPGGGGPYDPHGSGGEPPQRVRPRRHSERPFGQALLITILGTILPGSGLIIGGKRRIGGVILTIALLLFAVLAWFAVFRTRDLMHLAVNARVLDLISVALVVAGLLWVTLIVVTYRLLRPWRISPLGRGMGSVLVVGLAFAVMMPLAYGSRLVTVHDNTIDAIFADGGKSETTPKNVSAGNPWGGEERVNLLLLGGDGAANRQGVRTDTVMVASIDTDTGNTSLFSLPRNLQQLPFEPGSKLCEAYPDCTFDPGRKYRSPAEEAEYLLNAMYRNVPEQHPDLLKSDNPGADAMKESVGQALGLRIDYYMLVNLNGFEEMIDALGGITVNVNYPVPIGGNSDLGIPPEDYIEPGKNKHLDGEKALWFARGRYGLSDYQRMERQRCAMQAIIDQANPRQVLRRYEAIASEAQKILRTDIPKSLLGAFVDLSLKVKDAELSSRTFTTDLIDVVYPDYDKIRNMVDKALNEARNSAGSSSGDSGGSGGSSGSEDSGSSGGGSENAEGSESSGDAGTSGSDDASGSGESGTDASGDSSDSAGKPSNPCAYNPQSEE